MRTEPRPTVLSVDDDRDLTELISVMLEAEGYNVLSADNANAALEVLESEAPDLILLDVMMPGMDGFALCEVLQRGPKTSAIPVVFVTAGGADDHRRRAVAVGAAGFLAKPFGQGQLVEIVRKHLGPRHAHQPA